MVIMRAESDNGLPSWLPEWNGAEALASVLDPGDLLRDVKDLVDLVFSEDTEFLDSLPPAVESALVTPLLLLERAMSSDDDIVRVVVAARLVRRTIGRVLEQCPPELAEKLQELPA